MRRSSCHMNSDNSNITAVAAHGKRTYVVMSMHPLPIHYTTHRLHCTEMKLNLEMVHEATMSSLLRCQPFELLMRAHKMTLPSMMPLVVVDS